LHQQDSVGLVTFDNQIRAHIRPSSNPSHIQQILEVMESAQPKAKTSCGPIFHELAERFKKRGVVLILSDFFDDVQSLMAGVKHFRHRRHDVVMGHVLDAAELEFPFSRPTLFKGLEQLPDVQTDARTLRHAYLEEFGRFLTSVSAACRTHGIEHRQMRTDMDVAATLSNFLATRMAKVS
jgi:uncharacterized protein (DUF58 family)